MTIQDRNQTMPVRINVSEEVRKQTPLGVFLSWVYSKIPPVRWENFLERDPKTGDRWATVDICLNGRSIDEVLHGEKRGLKSDPLPGNPCGEILLGRHEICSIQPLPTPDFTPEQLAMLVAKEVKIQKEVQKLGEDYLRNLEELQRKAANLKELLDSALP